jgi:hypothetical protein
MKYLLLLTLLACKQRRSENHKKYMADLSALKKIIINSEKRDVFRINQVIRRK